MKSHRVHRMSGKGERGGEEGVVQETYRSRVSTGVKNGSFSMDTAGIPAARRKRVIWCIIWRSMLLSHMLSLINPKRFPASSTSSLELRSYRQRGYLATHSLEWQSAHSTTPHGYSQLQGEFTSSSASPWTTGRAACSPACSDTSRSFALRRPPPAHTHQPATRLRTNT